MFEHRLGLALGRFVYEIRGMPAEEFYRWKLFFLVEPWGWYDREYRTGAILAMLNNVNVSKRKDLKKESDYMRDMPELAMKAFREASGQDEKREKLLSLTIEERKRVIAQAFGGIAKEVKIGDSSNHSG